MLLYAMAFVVVAIVAAALGYAGIASVATVMAGALLLTSLIDLVRRRQKQHRPPR